jgi:hypothetical protein
VKKRYGGWEKKSSPNKRPKIWQAQVSKTRAYMQMKISLLIPRVSFLPPVFTFLPFYKNFGTRFPSSNLEEIRKTHSEKKNQGKTI